MVAGFEMATTMHLRLGVAVMARGASVNGARLRLPVLAAPVFYVTCGVTLAARSVAAWFCVS